MRTTKLSPGRFDVIRGCDEQDQVQGFASLYYGERIPIPTLEASYDGPLPARIVSVAAPGHTPRVDKIELKNDHQALSISTENHICRVELVACGARGAAVFVGADFSAIEPNDAAKNRRAP